MFNTGDYFKDHASRKKPLLLSYKSSRKKTLLIVDYKVDYNKLIVSYSNK